jgi:hypothetical protein
MRERVAESSAMGMELLIASAWERYGQRVADSLHVPRAEKAPALLLYFRESATRHPWRAAGCWSSQKPASVGLVGCSAERK